MTATTSSFATLARAAGPGWMISSALARLPVAMLPLTILMYGRHLTDSFAAAGLMVGGLSLGGAIAAPLVGALADRLGHRRTVLLLTGVAAAALVWLGSLAFVDVPLPVLVAACVAVGASNAQVGALARAGWSARFAGHPERRRLVEASSGYETVVDEVSFVAGPILGATLATVVHPLVALTVAFVILLASQTSFALLLPRGVTAAGPGGRRVGSAKVLVWLALALTVGGVFGTVQTGLTGTLADTPDAALTGLVYACVGFGSALSGAMTPRLARWSLPARVMVAGVVLAVAASLLTLTVAPWGLALASFVLGTGVAPLLVSCFIAAERLAPAGNAFVNTLISTAMVTGVGLGAALAGVLIETRGPAAALTVPAVLGVVAVVLGVLARLTGADAARES